MGKIDANNKKIKGIYIQVGGDMVNDGEILTDKDATIDIGVRGNYSSNKGKISQQNSIAEIKKWYQKPFGIVILAVIAGLIIVGVSVLLGWN